VTPMVFIQPCAIVAEGIAVKCRIRLWEREGQGMPGMEELGIGAREENYPQKWGVV